MDKNVSKMFSDIDKMNTDGALLTDNALSLVDEWIDTGSYALNGILSGSLYRGIPVGRITGLVGPSGCGKTLLMTKTFARAQIAGKTPVIWDSEMAYDAQTAKALGCDPSKIKHYPVETIESTRNQMATLLDRIIDSEMQGKFIFGLDSLGNLASEKEQADVLKNKSAVDMGIRAKAIKSMMRILTMKCAKAKTPLLFSNHIYDNPGALYPTLMKDQSGGKGPLYLASALVQLGTHQEKQDDKNQQDLITPISKGFSGVMLKALTVKNRFIPPFLTTDLYVNYKTGVDPYSGLVQMAKAFEVLTESRSGFYNFNDQKLGYAKDWKDNAEVWAQLLPALDEVLKKELTYSDESVKALTKEVADL